MGVPKDGKPLRIVGIDLGGTKLAVGLADERLRVFERTIGATVVDSADACLADIVGRIDEVMGLAGGADAIGVGAASTVDFARGRVMEAMRYRR